MYLLPNTTRKFSVLYISIMRNGFLMGNIWHLMPWHIYLSRIVLVPLTTMLGSKLSSIHRQAKLDQVRGDLHSYTIYQNNDPPGHWPRWWPGVMTWAMTRMTTYARMVVPICSPCPCMLSAKRSKGALLHTSSTLPFSLDLELPKHSRPSFLYFMYWRLQ